MKIDRLLWFSCVQRRETGNQRRGLFGAGWVVSCLANTNAGGFGAGWVVSCLANTTIRISLMMNGVWEELKILNSSLNIRKTTSSGNMCFPLPMAGMAKDVAWHCLHLRRISFTRSRNS